MKRICKSIVIFFKKPKYDYIKTAETLKAHISYGMREGIIAYLPDPIKERQQELKIILNEEFKNSIAYDFYYGQNRRKTLYPLSFRHKIIGRDFEQTGTLNSPFYMRPRTEEECIGELSRMGINVDAVSISIIKMRSRLHIKINLSSKVKELII